MTYRTPENLIRSIMSGPQPLEESATSANMNPALKTSDADRLSMAVSVLKSNGVDSAEAKDNAVSISAAHANMASDILDRALMHGVITVKPMLTSAEAIAIPTMHNPAMSEDKVEEAEINQGEVDENGEVKLQPRSLNNRMQNQIKKIDESIDDSDIITLVNTATRAVTSGEIAAVRGIEPSAEFDAYVANLAEAGHFQAAADGFFTKNTALVESVELDEGLSTNLKRKGYSMADASNYVNTGDSGRGYEVPGKDVRVGDKKVVPIKGDRAAAKEVGPVTTDVRKAKKAIRKHSLTKEEVEQIDELSYGKLKQYTKKGMEQVGKGDPMDARIARRKVGLDMARKQKVAKVTKAAFGESATPDMTLVRILKEAGNLRLVATHKSECGKHEAKIYKDRDWGEHRVKFMIHGKHHEPGDYHTDDVEDAHGTARHELKRLTKLNGALKEAVELGEDMAWLSEEIEQVDELSKALLGRYIKKAEKSSDAHGVAGDNYNKMGADKAADAHYEKGADRSKHVGRAAAKRNTEGMAMGAVDLHGKVKKRMFIDKEGNGHMVKIVAKEEVADEGDLPFQPIEEISKDCLTNYAVKATKSKNQHLASFTAKMARGNAVKGEPEVKAGYHKAAADSHRKMMNRHDGIKKAINKLGEEIEHLEELVKIGTYNNKAGSTLTMHRHPEDKDHHFLVHSGKVVDYHKGSAKDFDKKLKKDGFSGALHEVVDLTEGKKDEVEKAKKHLFKHPEADAIGQTIHNAIRHFNYSQDACDHVYSNHCKDVSYEDYHKMKPHLEATFKEHGLK